MKRRCIGLSALAALLCAGAAGAQADYINVRVNGEPIAFEGTQPREVNGRVMVPLRGVMEKLGASIDWMPDNQTVVATRGNTEIDLPIGSHTATINGRDVALDVPAMTLGGRTMVPLRFVSQALGADVTWSSNTQTVMIDTGGRHFSAYRNRPADDRPRPADRPSSENRRAGDLRWMVLPAGTIIPVTLDDALSSNENSAGDKFTATLRSGQDDAGLPQGTQIEGVVREAIPSRHGKPGVLDVDFQRIVFPNGDTRPLDGSLFSLNSKNVSRDSAGRLHATSNSNQGNERLKWVGIGAGSGLLISTLVKGNTLVDTLLGAGAGYLYNELQHKGAGNVHLGSGTEFGVRLNNRLAFSRNGSQ
jgi:uncharacterized Zn-binding protein involved in type VI secretion